MDHYHAYFETALDQIRQKNRYRFLRLQDRGIDFPLTTIKGHPSPVTVWCGVDYLGLTQHPILKQAMQESIQANGVGSGGTRTIGGTHSLHVALEKKLARWHRQEAGLLFNTGYVANEATLSTLAKIIPDLVFLSDADNHMSIIEGIRQGGARKIIFNHNDVADLEAKLQSLPRAQPKIIVFESVYSMSGDIAPIQKIIDLAEKYQAMTFLDEVHAVGVYGKTGAGVSEVEGNASKITIIQGTLSKGLGLFGGYITANHALIDCIRLHSNGFIFTVSLPPPLCAAAIAAIDYLHDHDAEKIQLFKIADFLKAEFSRHGFPVLRSPAQIIPILIGDSARCQAIADRLLAEHSIYIQAVNYPTVRQGQERLRISPTALHTLEMAEKLVQALAEVL